MKNIKLKILGQPNDEVLLTTDRRFEHYKSNEDRIIFKDGLLFRKCYEGTGSVKYYQILKSKQLVSVVLRSLHGKFVKQLGITETKIASREKYDYPNMAQLIWEGGMLGEQCIREIRNIRSLTGPLLQNPIEHITALENAWQIELVPELPPSGGFENIVTAMNIFVAFYLHTRHLIKRPKQLRKISLEY